MGKGGDDYVVVGYHYFIGQHHVLCHGKDDNSSMWLKEIQMGDKVVWSGSVSANTQLSINKPELFGGDKKEGGVVGPIDIEFGDSGQAANTYLVSKTPAPHSGNRGVLATVWRQTLIAANNPYLKKPSYVVKRIFNGWYSAKAECSNGGMNPAHIVYECLTNRAWGLGYEVADIDDSSFTEAADTLYSEGFGLCLAWTNQSSIEVFLQEVMDHCAGIISVNPFSGKFILTLIRSSSTSGLKTINDSNSKLIELQTQSWGDTTNKVTVTYFNISQKTKRSVTVHDSGNIRAQGRVVPQETSYLGIPNGALASRVALRDLRMQASPLHKAEFEVNRIGWDLRPGEIFKFSSSRHGIENMIMRVGNISLGTLTQGTIKISAVEDVFSLPSTSYAEEEEIGWIPPITEPIDPPHKKLVETPYWLLERKMSAADLAELGNMDTFVGGIASRPTNLSYNYELHTRRVSESYTNKGVGGWVPTFILTADVSENEAETILLVGEVSDGNLAQTNKLALLGNELVWVTNIGALLTSVTVKRGVIDTVPTAHSAGDILYIFQTYEARDGTTYSSGEDVWGKFLTLASDGLLESSNASEQVLPLGGRQGRPYPPGNVKVNGVLFATEFEGEFSASWSHRDKTLQVEDTPTFWTASNIGPETGVTYTLTLYGTGGSELREVTGITDDNYTYLLADEVADTDLPGGSLMEIPLLNGGAEYGDETGWTMLIGSFSAYPGAGGKPPYDGTYCWHGDINSYYSGISDNINLLTSGMLGSEIDAGLVAITVDWYQQTFSGYDAGRVGIRCFAVDGLTELTTFWSPWRKPLNWTHYTDRQTIPAGTRYIGILLEGDRADGSYNSAYFDLVRVFYDISDGLNDRIRMVLKAVKDGLDSWTAYDRTVLRPAPVQAGASTRRQKITIQGSKVPGALTDHTVLITEDNLDPAIWAIASLYGDDIFASDDVGSVRYPRAITEYDSIRQKLKMWVKLPTVNSGSNTDFYIYYGSGLSAGPSSDTFKSDYVAVINLEHPTPYDMSANGFSVTLTEENDVPRWFDETGDTGDIGMEQGLTHDGTNWYTSDNTSLQKRDGSWNIIAEKNDPLVDMGGSVNRIGDIDYYNGVLYVPATYYVEGEEYETDIRIGLFSATDLSFGTVYDITSANHDVSGLVVEPDKGVITMVDQFVTTSVYRHDLQTLAYSGVMVLSQPIQNMQGICRRGQYYYITSGADQSVWKVSSDGTVLGRVYKDVDYGWCGLTSKDDLLYIGMDNGINDQPVKELTETDGALFRAADWAVEKKGSYYRVPLGVTYNTATMEFWFSPDDNVQRSITSYVNPLVPASTDDRITTSVDDGDDFGVWDENNLWLHSGVDPALNLMHHGVVTWESGVERRIYHAGTSKAASGMSAPPAGLTELFIATGDESAARLWNGKIRQVRFASVRITTNEITTNYNNTNDPATFYSVSAEEQGIWLV